MIKSLAVAICLLTPAALTAQEAAAPASEPEGFVPLDAAGVDLEAFIWQKRVIVVFADSPFDPAYGEQIRYFEALWPEMDERDVVVITDTDPAARSPVRTKLRPRGFMLVLLGKDGKVALRKPFPWDVRELSRAIDKMPLRQEELRATGQIVR